MDNAIFQQTGGFPLETDTLNFMQNTYKLFNDFGAAIGEKTIVKGCTLLGSTVSDGTIYLNGELIEFRGGLQQSKIIVREEVILITEFKDGTTKDVYKKRYAQFGTGVGAINWSEFKRVYPLTSALFIDEIRMYGGIIDDIPAGWYLCDGTNGTRNLKGQFIAGLDPDNEDYDAIGNTGGEESVQLTEPQLPKHTPTGKTTYAGSHNHQYDKEDPAGSGSSNGSEDGISRFYTGYTNYSGNHRHDLDIDEIGNDEAHENRPPFYTLAFIQFKGI